ncbi:hypothetical protein [Bradyrhizobium canariense]|nr:hypothetical protein [Bradyrhizobium canariense]
MRRRVGRPLTPISYAGVAAGAYYAPTCAQVVDAYGRVVTRC